VRDGLERKRTEEKGTVHSPRGMIPFSPHRSPRPAPFVNRVTKSSSDLERANALATNAVDGPADSTRHDRRLNLEQREGDARALRAVVHVRAARVNDAATLDARI